MVVYTGSIIILSRNKRTVFVSGVFFFLVILFGCALVLLGVIMEVVPQNAFFCSAKYFAVNTGATLAIGAMFFKLYQIHKVFNSHDLVVKIIPNSRLALWLFMLAACESTALGVYNVYEPVRIEGPNRPLCIPDYSRSVVVMLLISVKAVLFVLSIYLLYRLRDVSTAFSDARLLSYVLYNLVVFSILGLFTVYAIDPISLQLSKGIIAGCMWCAVCAVLGLMFLPKAVALTHNANGGVEPMEKPGDASSIIPDVHSVGTRTTTFHLASELGDKDKGMVRRKRPLLIGGGGGGGGDSGLDNDFSSPATDSMLDNMPKAGGHVIIGGIKEGVEPHTGSGTESTGPTVDNVGVLMQAPADEQGSSAFASGSLETPSVAVRMHASSTASDARVCANLPLGSPVFAAAHVASGSSTSELSSGETSHTNLIKHLLEDVQLCIDERARVKEQAERRLAQLDEHIANTKRSIAELRLNARFHEQDEASWAAMKRRASAALKIAPAPRKPAGHGFTSIEPAGDR